ncbi:hypothetical protein [Pedobacter cryophilus]|uniref:Uncharacterized protein n=1 Tax=Pedobacter cryophilus TaxID=2571271 RepID=A0A4U1BXJ5_9SPHI|nr:hypothetical protein [Pedobacter cryophilus]TKB97742.1 hypothetical protein FA046_10285 [Pedobacter cryophilus]
MKLALFLILSIISVPVFAYQDADSLAYQLQRNKINEMLNARTQKFGQYDQSLVQKTGIFGLKTKRDMQNSINILTEIIETDNAILKETKTLLDFKNYQQERVESKSKESETRSLSYMYTINKLQTENEKKNAQLSEYKKDKKFYQIISYALGLAIISFALFAFRKISLK